MPLNRLILCSLLVFPLIGPGRLMAVPLNELVGPDQGAKLAGGENLSATQPRNSQPLLMPRHDLTQTLVRERLLALDPSFLVENLSAYRKPRGAASGSWNEAERSALYNGALALSTLAGLQYFSTSRNAMRTFYEVSTIIDGPNTKQPLADPTYGIPPGELTLYARQKDLTFGDNIYRYDYYARIDALIFMQENMSAMTAGIIPAVGKNRLRSLVAVIDAGDYLLIYAASAAKAAAVPGMNQRVGASFSTRAEAILKWFTDQADRAFERAIP